MFTAPPAHVVAGLFPRGCRWSASITSSPRQTLWCGESKSSVHRLLPLLRITSRFGSIWNSTPPRPTIRNLSPPKEPHDHREDQAQHEAGDDGEVKREVLLLDRDVS